MGKAKDLIVRPISAKDANAIIRALHYSGKIVPNSQVHLGVFLGDKCGGALQFGPSTCKRNLIGLVQGTAWNEFIELNRLAFADWLPRNGESRCIAFSLRWLKKNYPWLKWVVSFADGTQCGDGTIYRAAGFVLTGIRKNKELHRMPGGEVLHQIAAKASRKWGFYEKTKGRSSWARFIKETGGQLLQGFMLRYIYFLEPSCREKLTVPIIPFSEIQNRGAKMYRGKKLGAGSIDVDAAGVHPAEGGSTPTPALHITPAGA